MPMLEPESRICIATIVSTEPEFFTRQWAEGALQGWLLLN